MNLFFLRNFATLNYPSLPLVGYFSRIQVFLLSLHDYWQFLFFWCTLFFNHHNSVFSMAISCQKNSKLSFQTEPLQKYYYCTKNYYLLSWYVQLLHTSYIRCFFYCIGLIHECYNWSCFYCSGLIIGYSKLIFCLNEYQSFQAGLILFGYSHTLQICPSSADLDYHLPVLDILHFSMSLAFLSVTLHCHVLSSFE